MVLIVLAMIVAVGIVLCATAKTSNAMSSFGNRLRIYSLALLMLVILAPLFRKSSRK